MSTLFIPVVICGGSGSRLWPISRKSLPKQFVEIFNGKSLFELTLERSIHISTNVPIVVCSISHISIVRKIVKKMNIKIDLISEELGRNSAPAIFFAAKIAYERNKKSNILIMPSDHYIPDAKYFIKKIELNKSIFEQYNWTLFGIKPTYPATGYGYIKVSKEKNNNLVEGFIEKPKKSKAKTLISKGNCFWNSGMFIGSSEKILASIKSYSGDVYKSCDEVWRQRKLVNKSYILNKKYLNLVPSISIDYSVLEKEKSLGCIILETKWSDIGSWDSLATLLEELAIKEDKNIFKTKTKNTFIYNKAGLIVTIGLEDLIVINYKDATLIIKKGESERLKEIISKLEDKKRVELN